MSNKLRSIKRAVTPKPEGPRVVYRVSEAEANHIAARIAEWKQAAAFAKEKEKAVLDTLALIRAQQCLPERVNYLEAERVFVEQVTPEKPAVT